MLTFNRSYFRLFSLILTTEILIALYVHDSIIRPYIGDVLAVILIYCFLKSFLKTKVLPTAIFVLFVAFGIETLQYFNIVDKLGLQDSKIIRVILGTSFEWKDMLTYIVGIAIVLLTEKLTTRNPKPKTSNS